MTLEKPEAVCLIGDGDSGRCGGSGGGGGGGGSGEKEKIFYGRKNGGSHSGKARSSFGLAEG